MTPPPRSAEVVVLDLGSTARRADDVETAPAPAATPGRPRRWVLGALAAALLVLVAPQPRAVLDPGDVVVEIGSLRAAPATADTLGTADVEIRIRSRTWFDARVGVGGQQLDLPAAGSVAVALQLDPDCRTGLRLPVTAAASGGRSAFGLDVARASEVPALCPRPADGAAVTVTGWVTSGGGTRVRLVNHGASEALVTAATGEPESGPADACCGMTLGDYLDLARRPPALASSSLPLLIEPGDAVELELRPGEDPCAAAGLAPDLLEVRTQSAVGPVLGQESLATAMVSAADRACAASS